MEHYGALWSYNTWYWTCNIWSYLVKYHPTNCRSLKDDIDQTSSSSIWHIWVAYYCNWSDGATAEHTTFRGVSLEYLAITSNRFGWIFETLILAWVQSCLLITEVSEKSLHQVLHICVKHRREHISRLLSDWETDKTLWNMIKIISAEISWLIGQLLLAYMAQS